VIYIIKFDVVDDKIPAVNNDFFKTWSPEMAWCLGLIYTDGYLNEERIRIELNNTDKEMVEKFIKFIDSKYKLCVYHFKNVSGSYGNCKDKFYTYIHSDIMYNDLKSLGIFQKKSITIEFPAIYPQEFMADYIRGLWDGDGHIGVIKRDDIIVCSFTSGSHNFIYGLSVYLDNTLCLSKHSVSKNTNGTYIMQLYGNNAYKLCNYIYHSKMSDAYLTRKYNVWNTFKERKNI